jgi:hypothetical protein
MLPETVFHLAFASMIAACFLGCFVAACAELYHAGEYRRAMRLRAKLRKARRARRYAR